MIEPFLATALIVIAAALSGCNGAAPLPPLEDVTIKGETFHLEVASDDASITQGLMGRRSIPNDGGMLFVFPDLDVRSFWMGNCLIDIDVMFLDGRGRVTATHRMKAEPPRGAEESDARYRARMPGYSSVRAAQFAIELQAGSLDRLGVAVDDRVDMNLPRVKQRIR
jgi:uncharacterized membrane protein (UPF0127 family)